MQTANKQENSFLTIVWVALSCILIGAVIGATTNMINGYVSPVYFRNVMDWDFENIWKASIAQGIFEGLIYGIVFSIIFSSGVAIVTKGKASYSYLFPHLIKIMLLVYFCWIIGGITAMGLAALSPDFYKKALTNVPEDFKEMIAYAWVGGSILGSMFGGLLGITLGIIGIRTSWRKQISDVS